MTQATASWYVADVLAIINKLNLSYDIFDLYYR